MQQCFYFLFLLFSLNNCFGQSPAVTLKIVGSQRYLTFYNDETLKKNKNGEVTAGTLLVDQMLIPQGTTLNISFQHGGLIRLNESGKVISGTLTAHYYLKSTTGVSRYYESGDEVTFNAKGQVTDKAQPKEKEIVAEKREEENNVDYGKICNQNNIPFYCSSIEFASGGNGSEEIASGIVAKSNVQFIPCGGFGIKAKKNTYVGFYVGSNFSWVGDERKIEISKQLAKCAVGTVRKMTIDGSHKFLVYGAGTEIEFPDGSEIEFEDHILKPVLIYKFYNYVISVKLGKDAYIPTLGLVKKGKTVRGNCTMKDGVQPYEGYLSVDE